MLQLLLVVCLSQRLYLDYNAIFIIDEDAFRNTTSLEGLYISHNLLASLPPIQDLADTLIYLIMAYNQIQMIPELYFASCATLEWFDISFNNITMINNMTFLGLASLSRLYIRDNMVEDTVDHVIWYLRRLTRLYLDGNRLTRLPSLVTDTAQIRRLSVTGNDISDITEKQMLDARRIITLDISHTLITELDFISALSGIKHLYASNMPVSFSETFLDGDNGPHLTSLVLSGNRLDTLPLFSASKDSLKEVDLSQNELRCVDLQHLANMSNLQNLYLEYNDIERFPDARCRVGNNFTEAWHDVQFPSLEKFRVDNNQLTDLALDILEKMPGLIQLNASFNNIEHMPMLSALGVSLTYANLEHNKIRYIEEEHITGLSSLQILRLAYNKITYLNLHILTNLNSLQLFDLRHNKLATPPILTSVKFQSEFKHFHSSKCTWKCRLRNGGHFVSSSVY